MVEGVADDAPTQTLDAQLAEARPASDRVAMERARSRVERGLFAKADPAKLGRYTILDPIARGGMGVVYGAYDPELDRRVALKVVNPMLGHNERSRRRLVTEARALAKLDHPNVVKVHDVLTIDDQVVIVMELVDGKTLAAWQSEVEHDWRDTVAVYAQVADGLDAAHGVDVVHRDFKPANAIIGDDGRVRVLDFGLARLAHSEDGPSDAPTGAVDATLTQTGDVLGTLAFSSPEQLEGRTATSASDQFSFCVALHVAVEGVSPFTGATAAERCASIRSEVIARAVDGRRVPPWLRKLITRGLAAEPGERHRAMRDIQRELRRTRGWRRWRFPALGVATLGVAIAGTAAISSPNDEPTCDGGIALVESAWNPGARDRVRGAIDAIGTPYALETRDRLLAKLDAYAGEWENTHRGACLGHQRGDTSELLLDRQMVCLSRRLGDLRAAVGVLGNVDVASLTRVMDVASGIPSVSTCADLEAVQSDLEPPSTPTIRMQVADVRAQISAAEAQAHAGRSDRALATLATARASARATPYPPVHVEAALAEGRIRIAQHDLRAALAVLGPARKAAFELHMLPAGLEASARIIYAEGQIEPRLDRLERELEYLRPLTDGLRGDHFTGPLLLNNVGTVYLAAGRRRDAAGYFEEAKARIRRNDPGDLELTIVDLNLVMVTSDAPSRETIARGVWRKLRDALGEHHRSAIDASIVYALYTSDPAIAFDVLGAAASSYERFHPAATHPRMLVHAKRAMLATELGNTTLAIELYLEAIEKMQGDTSPDVTRWRKLCSGELALLRGEPQRAIAELSPIYQARIESANWWERAEALRAEVGMGQSAAALRDDDKAIAWLQHAIAKYPDVFAMNEEVEYRRYLARAHRTLAALLRERDPAAAEAHDQEARTFYRGAASYRWILDALPERSRASRHQQDK